jgi:hypothetical protein
VLLYPSLNISLRLAQIEAFAVRYFITRDFIYASGGSACEAVAAVCGIVHYRSCQKFGAYEKNDVSMCFSGPELDDAKNAKVKFANR